MAKKRDDKLQFFFRRCGTLRLKRSVLAGRRRRGLTNRPGRPDEQDERSKNDSAHDALNAEHVIGYPNDELVSSFLSMDFLVLFEIVNLDQGDAHAPILAGHDGGELTGRQRGEDAGFFRIR